MDALTWGALITAAGSLAAVIKFWIDYGKALQRITAAEGSIAVAMAKTDLANAALNEYRVEVAKEYITSREMNEAVSRIEKRLEQMMAQNTDQHTALTRRLDALFTPRKEV